MEQDHRELTGRERQRIRRLVVSLCANYDREYGCLPLGCDCYMFGICYRSSSLCKYFRRAVQPVDPELEAIFEPRPLSVCKQCGKSFPTKGKRCYCSDACAAEARQRQTATRVRRHRERQRNQTM